MIKIFHRLKFRTSGWCNRYSSKVKQKMHSASIQCVFAQWIFIGLLIPFVDWEVAPWFKGLIIGILAMMPIALLAFGRANRSPIPIIVFAAILVVNIAAAHDLLTLNKRVLI